MELDDGGGAKRTLYFSTESYAKETPEFTSVDDQIEYMVNELAEIRDYTKHQLNIINPDGEEKTRQALGTIYTKVIDIHQELTRFCVWVLRDVVHTQEFDKRIGRKFLEYYCKEQNNREKVKSRDDRDKLQAHYFELIYAKKHPRFGKDKIAAYREKAEKYIAMEGAKLEEAQRLKKVAFDEQNKRKLEEMKAKLIEKLKPQ